MKYQTISIDYETTIAVSDLFTCDNNIPGNIFMCEDVLFLRKSSPDRYFIAV